MVVGDQPVATVPHEHHGEARRRHLALAVAHCAELVVAGDVDDVVAERDDLALAERDLIAAPVEAGVVSADCVTCLA
ncbi:MAG TPA: hypothetical protein VID96_02855 [Xanthobacteraceae bacterium]